MYTLHYNNTIGMSLTVFAEVFHKLPQNRCTHYNNTLTLD